VDPQRWHRLETLFEQATALPASRRDAFLAGECGGDAELADELRSLLRAHDAQDGPLDTPPSLSERGTDGDAVQPPGTRLGVWRLGEVIGRGGAGEVYAATRADGSFEQRVAVKLLQREAARELGRFQLERQILARLEHPGIARLLDGGLSDEGRPYAVVEYVEGETITAHCRSLGADLRYRLQLFMQVCEVVAYAHRNLVVHRDLKPANILVTPEGRVKLLDFGVAKQLDQAGWDGDRTSAPLTPDYAAPEQLTGQPVTTATDVYALGVLLFELLAGDRPWRSGSLPLARAVQLIVHDEPPAPSRAAARHGAAALVEPRRLAGDLDAIVATSLRKDPAHRYPTVDALRRDVERHLADEPVAARGRARWYVWGRTLHRYRWGVAAGTLVFASLAVGLAATAWQAQRAAVERDIARRGAEREEAVRYYLISMFRASIARTGDQRADGAVSAKAMLDRTAQRVLKQYGDDPQLAGKVVVTLADLYGALEDVEGQVPLLEGFLAAADSRADPESVALAQQKLAHVELMRGHVERAAALLPRAEALWASAPERYREQRLEGLIVRALLQRNRGDLAGSIATYRQAIPERVAFSGETHRETALLHNSLAITLTGANRLDEAMDAYRKTLAIYEKLGLSDEFDALVILGNTGTLAFRTGRLHEAEKVLKTAFEKQRLRAGDSAAVAASMGLYGAALTAQGRAREALDLLHTATEMAVRFAGAASPLAIQDRMFLGEAHAAAGDLKAARRVAEENLGHARSRFGEGGLLTLRARLAIARLLLQEGEATGSHAAFVELVPAFEKLGLPAQTQLAHALVGAGEALLAQGKATDAVAPLRRALALREQLLWADSWEVAQARARLGEALKAAGQGSEGSDLLRQGLKALQGQLGEGHPQTLRAKAALARGAAA
jgi:tetratricopeptide (TPR) repeat protein